MIKFDFEFSKDLEDLEMFFWDEETGRKVSDMFPKDRILLGKVLLAIKQDLDLVQKAPQSH